MRRERGPWSFARLLAPAVPLLLVGSCGGVASTPSTTSTVTTSIGGNDGGTTSAPLTARVAVSPDQGVAGTSLTFTVDIRGPGTLNEESVQFGDGGTTGANAGVVTCGQTARADRNSTYVHAYGQPGTYIFRDVVSVLRPQPACTFEEVKATSQVVVAASLSSATFNGAFVSPTNNIACYIDATKTDAVRCATFSPPRLVTMNATGSFHTCSGNTCDLGNPAMETPVLPYGSATGSGPFQCLSTAAGMTCTVTGHRGFTIARAGVSPVG